MISIHKKFTRLRFACSFSALFFFLCLTIFSCKEEEKKPPVIASFSPTSGSAGTAVTITGTNFSPTVSNNIVNFNGTPATVTAVTPSSLTVTVPTGASTGKISVTTDGITATSAEDFTVFNSPEITTISPAFGFPGESIVITGKNFSTTPAENTVKFNSITAAITAATTTSLTATVPAGTTTGKITITVHELTTTSADDFVVPPTVTSFSPSSGLIGSSVTITGTGFNTTIANNIVKFNNKIATVTAVTSTSLTVTVPAEALTDKITVTVSGKTATSATDFVILPKITSFSPTIGAIGSAVTINGTGFSTTILTNIIKVNGTTATVTAATATSVTIVVPVGATSGKISVAVGGNTAVSETDYQVVVEVVKAGGAGFEQGYSIVVDAAGNTFVTGMFNGTTTFGNNSLTSAGSQDMFLAKYNSSCELIWVKQFGGASTDEGISIALDAAGNIYATGTFAGSVSFGTTVLSSALGSGDIFVAKFNASGDPVWAKQIGSGSANVETGYAVKVDDQGNLYLAGMFLETITVGANNLTSTGASDILIVKYNSTSGDVIWVKGFGGLDFDQGMAIAFGVSGDVYVSGSFFGTTTIGTTNLISAGGLDAFLTKLNSSGDVIWAKQISGSDWENTFSIATDANGNCYVSGYFIGTTTLGTKTINSAGNEDVFLAKYNPSGEVLWVKSLGGTDYDHARSVAVDATGNAYVTGHFARTATFGDKTLTSNNNSPDVFVSKFNSLGEVIWTKQAGGSDNDYGQSIAVDAAGTVFITGSFRNTVVFGTTAATSSGGDDIFIWKIRQ